MPEYPLPREQAKNHLLMLNIPLAMVSVNQNFRYHKEGAEFTKSEPKSPRHP
jgi:hypothetical protein